MSRRGAEREVETAGRRQRGIYLPTPHPSSGPHPGSSDRYPSAQSWTRNVRVATTAQPDLRHKSMTMPGDVEELGRVYTDFHPKARAPLDACDSVTKSLFTCATARRRLPSHGSVHGPQYQVQ